MDIGSIQGLGLIAKPACCKSGVKFQHLVEGLCGGAPRVKEIV